MKITLTQNQKQALLKSIKEDCHTNAIGLDKEVAVQAKKFGDKLDSSSVAFLQDATKQEFINDNVKTQIKLAKEINKFCNEKAFKENTIDLSETQVKQICDYLDKDIIGMKNGKQQTINVLKKFFEPMIKEVLAAQISNESISETEKQEIIAEATDAAIQKGLSSPEQKANLQKFDDFLKRDLDLKSVFENALKSSERTR